MNLSICSMGTLPNFARMSPSMADLRVLAVASLHVLPSRSGKKRLRVNQPSVTIGSSACGWVVPPVFCAIFCSSASCAWYLVIFDLVPSTPTRFFHFDSPVFGSSTLRFIYPTQE